MKRLLVLGMILACVVSAHADPRIDTHLDTLLKHERINTDQALLNLESGAERGNLKTRVKALEDNLDYAALEAYGGMSKLLTDLATARSDLVDANALIVALRTDLDDAIQTIEERLGEPVPPVGVTTISLNVPSRVDFWALPEGTGPGTIWPVVDRYEDEYVIGMDFVEDIDSGTHWINYRHNPEWGASWTLADGAFKYSRMYIKRDVPDDVKVAWGVPVRRFARAQQ